MTYRSDECDLAIQTKVAWQKIRYISNLGLHMEVAWVTFEKSYLCNSFCHKWATGCIVALSYSLNVAQGLANVKGIPEVFQRFSNAALCLNSCTVLHFDKRMGGLCLLNGNHNKVIVKHHGNYLFSSVRDDVKSKPEKHTTCQVLDNCLKIRLRHGYFECHVKVLKMRKYFPWLSFTLEVLK